MKRLATFVDSLIERSAATVSENHRPAVTLDGLAEHDAVALCDLLREAGLTPTVTDALDDNALGVDERITGDPPFSVSFTKPSAPGETFFVSTRALGQWLSSPVATHTVRVASCETAFATEAFVVAAPNANVDDVEPTQRRSPRSVVRDNSGQSIVPMDVRPYLLASSSPLPVGDCAFEEWRARAASAAALCLANEVSFEGRLEFVGVVRTSIAWVDPAQTSELADWFEAVQEAVRWVFEIDREVELRHRLFSQEFARAAYGQEALGEAMLSYAPQALEGARIGYAFHLQEISKDSLKSLSELRKSISDETQKLFETTRQLGLSAAGALFYASGLVAARMAAGLSNGVFAGLLLLGALYIGLILSINYRAVRSQQELRKVWRTKIYRYLTDAEFKVLVDEPIGRAEVLVKVTLWGVYFLAMLTFLAGAVLYGHD